MKTVKNPTGMKTVSQIRLEKYDINSYNPYNKSRKCKTQKKGLGK
jgi:hypothetical protein